MLANSRTHGRERGWALTLLLLASWSGASEAGEFQCEVESPTISVMAVSDTLAAKVCDAALGSIEVLEGCGLFQVSPIVLEIIDGPIDDDSGCFGAFNGDSNGILLLAPERLSDVLPLDHALHSIPAESLFASIITHEMAHAFLYQTRGGAGDTIAEDEYVAYAMQYLSLSEADREAVLQAMPGKVKMVSRDMLNEMFLSLAPEIFGSWAWRHFKNQDDGCAFIEEIIAEQIDFSPVDDFRRNNPHGCKQ